MLKVKAVTTVNTGNILLLLLYTYSKLHLKIKWKIVKHENIFTCHLTDGLHLLLGSNSEMCMYIFEKFRNVSKQLQLKLLY